MHFTPVAGSPLSRGTTVKLMPPAVNIVLILMLAAKKVAKATPKKTPASLAVSAVPGCLLLDGQAKGYYIRENLSYMVTLGQAAHY